MIFSYFFRFKQQFLHPCPFSPVSGTLSVVPDSCELPEVFETLRRAGILAFCSPHCSTLQEEIKKFYMQDMQKKSKAGKLCTFHWTIDRTAGWTAGWAPVYKKAI
jgi:hypothetical protein